MTTTDHFLKSSLMFVHSNYCAKRLSQHIFAALHGMQTRSSNENSVRLSHA